MKYHTTFLGIDSIYREAGSLRVALQSARKLYIMYPESIFLLLCNNKNKQGIQTVTMATSSDAPEFCWMSQKTKRVG